MDSINLNNYKLNFNIQNSYYKILNKNDFNIKISFEKSYSKEIDYFIVKSLSTEYKKEEFQVAPKNDSFFANDMFTDKSLHITIRVDNEIILYGSIIIGIDNYCTYISKGAINYPVTSLKGDVLELNKIIIDPRIRNKVENNKEMGNIIFEFLILFLCWFSNENSLGFIYSTIDYNDVESFLEKYSYIGAKIFSKNKLKFLNNSSLAINDRNEAKEKSIFLTPIAFTFTRMYFNWNHLIRVIFNNDKEYFKYYIYNSFKKYYILNNRIISKL
ncbi:hypothetical protein DICPUDRAFT_83717 [Dictyostelium purpureum]|uniref:Uncharacterized protein n=1 Tax=Dictyostelium purpureum TaxID=5786 RepID=F1A0E1_DICPU|nr:uncharacterized protein DICPUDRAFT_83717 [Dictyostelium purpureum]EGC30342.1 hypothetical protein DICPUDRAFT_83717 [Dictyostelium purpureum]|eukprot:XP_003293139.1 hypothetical protein DICPUDRAFT_83717 [Dictyostelium purpureum]